MPLGNELIPSIGQAARIRPFVPTPPIGPIGVAFAVVGVVCAVADTIDFFVNGKKQD